MAPLADPAGMADAEGAPGEAVLDAEQGASTGFLSVPIVLVRPTPWSLRFGAYAGLGLHTAGARLTGQGLAGVELMGTISHAELGLLTEMAELQSLYQHAYGGTLGVLLPLRGFVDISSGVGLLARRYLDCESHSCAEEFSTLAATIRLGISDRVGGRLGGRIGAEIRALLDFERRDVRWRLPPTPAHPQGISGVDHFGGSAVTLLVKVALDWAPGLQLPRAPAPPREPVTRSRAE